MSEIKVGEYVRTIDGYIRKVTQVNRKGSYEALCYGAYSVDKKYKNSVGISAKKIKSHSKDIIDLIKVGDYVNGTKVHSVDYSTNLQTGERYLVIDKIYTSVKYIYEKDIKTILTHEQYEANCYRVGGTE